MEFLKLALALQWGCETFLSCRTLAMLAGVHRALQSFKPQGLVFRRMTVVIDFHGQRWTFDAQEGDTVMPILWMSLHLAGSQEKRNPSRFVLQTSSGRSISWGEELVDTEVRPGDLVFLKRVTVSAKEATAIV